MTKELLSNLHAFFKKEINKLDYELNQLNVEVKRIRVVLVSNFAQENTVNKLMINSGLIKKSTRFLKRINELSEKKYELCMLKLHVKKLLYDSSSDGTELMVKKTDITHPLSLLMKNLEENECYEQCMYLKLIISEIKNQPYHNRYTLRKDPLN